SDSSSDDKASPEDTVRGFIAATQDMNPEKIAGFCTEDFAKGLGLENIEEITEGTTAKYSNISIEVVEQGEYDAVVNVS
ncbi:MAG: hypothetical protein GY845_17955, partial [Planctomycetes bacterium]|nr:hypothetical protein [Planctomycetota bacterium]